MNESRTIFLIFGILTEFMEVWTEKYRPKSLKDVIGQEKIVKRLILGGPIIIYPRDLLS